MSRLCILCANGAGREGSGGRDGRAGGCLALGNVDLRSGLDLLWLGTGRGLF